MTPYYVIYALVLGGVLICFMENVPARRLACRIYFVCILLILATFAGVRSSHVDRDFETYEFWFNAIAAGTATEMGWLRDPLFGLLSYIVSRLGLHFSIVALIYAFCGLIATMYFAASAPVQRWATLFFYLLFCQYYIVGEMTEIRSAVAIPLMAMSLYLACEKRRLKAVAVYVLALAFHFSAILVLPVLILLLADVQFRSRMWVYSLAVLGLIASFGMSRVIDTLSGVYRISEMIGEEGTAHGQMGVTWYGLAHILTIAICVFMLWNKMSLHQRIATICCTLGTMLFQIFGSNRILAIRLLSVFDFYWLFLLVVILERLKGDKRFAYILFLIVVGFTLYFQSLKYYVEPYSTIFY